MSDKKQITINLDEDSINKMDKLCEKLNMKRPQVLRLLFSGNPKNIKFICDALINMEDGLFGGAHDVPDK